jgi:hypothetical protein
MILILFCLSLLYLFVRCDEIPAFNHCPMKSSTIESRQLFVATCDTRSGWKEFQALKVWNITGSRLRNEGLSMKNLCTGLRWGLHGFLTKPLLYYDYIQSILQQSASKENLYIILMDSDTFWSAGSIATLWNRYDCARAGKDVLVSTEMSCWIGKYCSPEDLNRWYSKVDHIPSYSPFANSGVIMGKASLVGKMLDHVIRHNKSYYITYKKHKFDDQLAIADYSINVAPQEVALDYHQQFSASCSVHTVGEHPDIGWPFVCKHRNGTLYPHCPDFTRKLARHSYFRVDDASCHAYRQVTEKTPERAELQTLAPYPVIWHGNGAGKWQFLSLAHSTFLCNLKRLNMTEKEHWNTFG